MRFGDVVVDDLEAGLQRLRVLVARSLQRHQVDEDNGYLSHFRQVLHRLLRVHLQATRVRMIKFNSESSVYRCMIHVQHNRKHSFGCTLARTGVEM